MQDILGLECPVYLDLGLGLDLESGNLGHGLDYQSFGFGLGLEAKTTGLGILNVIIQTSRSYCTQSAGKTMYKTKQRLVVLLHILALTAEVFGLEY